MSSGLPTEQMALDAASRVCGLADGVPMQATALVSRNRLTRLGGGVVLHHADIDNVRVIVRALINGAEGVVFTNDLSPDGLKMARDRAVETARLTPAVPDRPGLPNDKQAGVPMVVDSWDDATAVGNPEAEAVALGQALEASRAQDAVLAGILGRVSNARAVVNTNGLARTDRSTSVHTRLIATCGEGSGHAGILVGREADLDLPALAAKAARIGKAASKPHGIEAGRYDVVLEPEAVIELLEWLSMIAFGARPWQEGRSFLKGNEGKPLTGSVVSLYDPGPTGRVSPVRFDWEGVARKRVDFICDGRGGTVVHDRVSAHQSGCTSTGHWAVDDRFPVDGPTPGAVVMAPGKDAGNLVERLEHGLHVQRFHYVNGLLDPQKARMTGLTRDGLFEIRDGQPIRAVRDLRFTENILEAFGRIDAISELLHSVSTFWAETGGAYAAPALLIRDFTFTGTCEV